MLFVTWHGRFANRIQSSHIYFYLQQIIFTNSPPTSTHMAIQPSAQRRPEQTNGSPRLRITSLPRTIGWKAWSKSWNMLDIAGYSVFRLNVIIYTFLHFSHGIKCNHGNSMVQRWVIRKTNAVNSPTNHLRSWWRVMAMMVMVWYWWWKWWWWWWWVEGDGVMVMMATLVGDGDDENNDRAVLMTIAITMTFVAEVFGMVNLIMTIDDDDDDDDDDYDEVEDSHCMRLWWMTWTVKYCVVPSALASYHVISYHIISYHAAREGIRCYIPWRAMSSHAASQP